jgi:hypothetical protein
LPGRNGGDWWLWIYPGEVTDWQKVLADGVRTFESKPRWEGQRPNLLGIHPKLQGEAIEAAAAALNLRIVLDHRVHRGVYRLGLESKGGEL